MEGGSQQRGIPNYQNTTEMVSAKQPTFTQKCQKYSFKYTEIQIRGYIGLEIVIIASCPS
jgi:hypothetical protein